MSSLAAVILKAYSFRTDELENVNLICSCFALIDITSGHFNYDTSTSAMNIPVEF